MNFPCIFTAHTTNADTHEKSKNHSAGHELQGEPCKRICDAGATQFFFNDWVRQPGVAISCCNDGLRPVFFKIEATDEEVETT